MSKTTAKLPRFIADDKALPTRTVEVVEIHRETAKALLADVRASASEADNCLRCGKKITDPASRMVGYGPDCLERLGFPRPSADDGRVWAEAVREEIWDTVYKELWIPKRYVEGLEQEPILLWFEDDDSTNGKFFAQTPYELKELCKEAAGGSGRWREANDGNKYWRWDASPEIARGLATVFDGYVVKTTPKFNEFLNKHHDPNGIKQAKNLPGIPITKTEPWEHQKRAFHFAKSLDGAVMLDCGMGSGKSKMTLDIISNDPQTRWVLIVAPNKVCKETGWGEQLANHFAGEYEALYLGYQSVPDKAEQIMSLYERTVDDAKVRFVVINYESTWRAPLGPWLKETGEPTVGTRKTKGVVPGVLETIPWDYVVADESHRIKSDSARQTKMLYRLGAKTNERIALTGTPMGESPLDIFGQFRFLDPAIFGDNWWAFRNKFALTEERTVGKGSKKRKIDVVVGVKNKDILYKKFNLITFSVGEEVLDLPPTHTVFRQFELSKEAKDIYIDLYERMSTEIADGTLTPGNAAVRIMRLQQITGGFAKLDKRVPDDAAKTVRVDGGKQEELKEVLEDTGPKEPVVVFCWFHDDLDIVQETAKSLGYPAFEMSGRGRDERDEWNAAGRGVLAVQIQSGAEGVNDLVQAHYGIYYTVGRSNTKFDQSLKRLDRPGQNNPVTFIQLSAEGFHATDKYGEQVYYPSADEIAYEALANKKSLIQSVKQLERKGQACTNRNKKR